jgi:outer membrane receptor protein involved in Fe transport
MPRFPHPPSRTCRTRALDPRPWLAACVLGMVSGMAGAQSTTVAASLAAPAPLAPSPQPDASSSAPPLAVTASVLDPVEVTGNTRSGVGAFDAASQGTVTAQRLASRPTLRPADVLESVPGVIVSQHSGDGKANQYYLRGFNLDHGTDFATFVDGMPVNMPTHAHGQGYSDLNWLIPELIDRIAYKKGPYSAEEGDFASAGAAHIDLRTHVAPSVSTTIGAHGYRRVLLLGQPREGPLMFALEGAHNDGPWENPERFHRTSGALRLNFGSDDDRTSLTAMGYDAAWQATDQVPERVLAHGTVGRFGAIDASDHGRTSRASLSLRRARRLDDGDWSLDAYAIRSQLDLFSNFTFALEHPYDLGPVANPSGLRGDQFEQAERRTVLGLNARRAWSWVLAGRESTTTLGLQARHDRLDPVGLYSAEGGERVGVTQESRVRQTSAALYAEHATVWNEALRSVLGWRIDRLDAEVSSSIAANSGRRRAAIASPKLSLVAGPWRRTEFFLNLGRGFHSNDARGLTETITPKEGLATEPVSPLVRTQGSEIGVRTEAWPGLQSSLVLWQLRLDSELVFVGDAGDTEATRPSRRHGIEWTNHWQARPWLQLDADLALSKARYTDDDPAGRAVPGAVETVASFGATVSERGPWFGQLQWRYFGPRALSEDDSQRSRGTLLANLRVGYRFAGGARCTLDVFNLFDRRASDVDYLYASRLPGEPAAGVQDLHTHPAEPRSLRVSLTLPF